MSNDISIAKENIYSFPSQFDFFKQNDLQSACYKLTCDIEEIFLGLLSTQMVMTDFDRIAILSKSVTTICVESKPRKISSISHVSL